MSGHHPGGPPPPVPGRIPGPPGSRRTTSDFDLEGRRVQVPDLGNDFAGRSRSLPGGPLGRVGGVSDPLGLGQLGRADLDPWAPIGPGTGMLADPRGMRQPQPGVPGVPPGARFDPYGPTAPPPPNFGTGGTGPFPRPGPGQDPFGPTPDHLPMPTFPGVEPPVPGQPIPRRNPPPFGGPSPDVEQPPPGFDDMFM